jgi:hypothetical protein
MLRNRAFKSAGRTSQLLMIGTSPDDRPPNERRVCGNCVRESYLIDLIARNGIVGPCDYCHHDRPTISIEELSKHVGRAIEQFYEYTSSEPEGYDYYLQQTGNWERPGELIGEVITQLLETDEAVSEDVRQVLDDDTSDFDSVAAGDEQPFDAEAQYAEISRVDVTSLSAEYRKFERLVIEEARYFSPQTRSYLRDLFNGLEGLRTRDGRPILVEAGPDREIKTFYRARVFQDDAQLKKALTLPDQELGPPPARMGRAGRLNAAGVPIFYGADVAKVAVAEVRPPVGSKVVVARFELLRPLRLLDIEALKSLLVEGSFFDPEYMGRLQRAAFLDSFSIRFTQPVMPDHEAFEYIPTQAIADYLANEVEPQLDGILYASPQSGGAGKNVALFHRASRVEQRATPHGMTSFVSFGIETEDDYEIDYSVYEQVPEESVPRRRPRPRFVAQNQSSDQNERTPSLRIELDSLAVHHINAVEVRSEAHSVGRMRHTQGRDSL